MGWQGTINDRPLVNRIFSKPQYEEEEEEKSWLLDNFLPCLNPAAGTEKCHNCKQMYLKSNRAVSYPLVAEDPAQSSQSLWPLRSGFSAPETPDTDSTFAERTHCRNDLQHTNQRSEQTLKWQTVILAPQVKIWKYQYDIYIILFLFSLFFYFFFFTKYR